MNIIQTIQHPHLFAPWFKSRGMNTSCSDSWLAWSGVLKAMFALAMTDEEHALFTKITGRTRVPVQPVREAWLIVGRRGGKSFVCALVAVYLACFYDYAKYLTLGERAVVMILASDRKQAQVILRYVRALINEVSMLRAKVERETQDGIELDNQVSIEVHTSSFRAVRGYTVVACLC